jgi:RHS repeat-associated protein
MGSAKCYQLLCRATQIDALTDTTFDNDGRPIARTGAASNPTGLPTAFTASYTNNRLTTFNGAAWTYDTQGNLAGDGTNTYVWDVRNRLIQIKQGATVTASFEYDALNRRVRKTVAGVATEYLHDDITPVQEKRAGDVTQLITGPGIDDYLSRITTTTGTTPVTTARNYLTDFLGSTTALADDSGMIKTTYGYEPYGEVTISGEATANSFQYTARENDGTGLMYYRARYYHSKAKRFISEDPIGQNAGPNVYAYVDGDPVNFYDPDGLVEIYRDGGVTFQSFPGQPAGGNEHARAGEGKNYHIHIKDGSGREARISTETWKPLTPDDERIFNKSKQMQNACEKLTDGEKKFFDRVNRQIFHRGYPTVNQVMRIGSMRGGGRAPVTRGGQD